MEDCQINIILCIVLVIVVYYTLLHPNEYATNLNKYVQEKRKKLFAKRKAKLEELSK